MAKASPSESSLECPICHEDFDEAKLLPCAHLACKKCVLSWLCNSGGEGGCPLCRAPILPSNHSAQDEGDLVRLVDALPTNFAVMALVESRQVLNSPNECGLCDDVTSTSYCLQCNVKLCKDCAKGHRKIPSTKKHAIEDMKKLNAQRLAEIKCVLCKAHPDRLVKLYCPAHKEVVCLMCASTSHENCTGLKSIVDAVDKVRAEFKDRACALRHSEATIAQQIKDVKDAYKVVRKRVKDTFDDIQKTTEKRKQQLEREIQAQEDVAMTAIKSKDTTRASLASNANTLEQLVSTAPQAALLAMVADLTSRLDQLQSHTATTTAGQLQVPEFTVDDSTLRQLKFDISSFGQITMASQKSNSTTATRARTGSTRPIPRPRTEPLSTSHPMRYDTTDWSYHTAPPLPTSSGSTSSSQAASSQSTSLHPEELAKILKVGDRVKRGRDWDHWYYLKWSLDVQGRVTAIPSRRAAAGGWDPSGWVDVRWDGDVVDRCHEMGAGGRYVLDLV